MAHCSLYTHTAAAVVRYCIAGGLLHIIVYAMHKEEERKKKGQRCKSEPDKSGKTVTGRFMPKDGRASITEDALRRRK